MIAIALPRPTEGRSQGLLWSDEHRLFAGIMAAAAILRLAMVPGAGIYHPDELFQYLEQAHRLLFGQGVVPWEYRYGMRSWLLPLALAPWMAMGNALGPGTALYLLLPRAAAAVLSLGLVASAWFLGRRFSTTHAALAAGIAAIWPEFVYLAPHILSETLSIALILPAIVLLTGRADPRRQYVAGILLALAVVLRLQHLPAIATLAVLACGRDRPVLARLAAGGMAGAAASALLDLSMGLVPFGWALEYVRQNLLFGRAGAFGVEPAWAYAQAIGQSYGAFTWPLLGLAAVGARKVPILFRVGLVNLAVHMAIGHKEYRFVLLTTAILPLLAAIGTAEVSAAVIRWRPTLGWRVPTIAFGCWVLSAAGLAGSGRVDQFAALDGGTLAFYGQLRNDAGLCGLATQGVHFSAGGGYAYLHRAVPIYAYAPGETALMRGETRGFNRLLASAVVPPPPGFHVARCTPGNHGEPGECLFERAGGCAGLDSSAEINCMLVRTDQ